MTHIRERLILGALLAVTLVTGLTSRHPNQPFGEFAARHAGDALWALAVFWGFAFLLPRKSPLMIGALALGFSFAIEASQLLHFDWLQRIRENRLGALVLGRGFLAIDLLRYAVGVVTGVSVWALLRKRKPRIG